MRTVIRGNILDSNEDFILQQCNCVTLWGKGLSDQIARKFGVDVYSYRTPITNSPKSNVCSLDTRSTVGTVYIVGGNQDKPQIINLFGQYLPSHPRAWHPHIATEAGVPDDYSSRERYFKEGLDALIEDFKDRESVSIAVPYGIGCGLAGGNWLHYEKMLDEFEEQLSKLTNLKLVYYRL